jgi:sortase A
MRKSKIVFVSFVILVIGTLLFTLFKNDLSIIVQQTTEINVFSDDSEDITQGYVEYINESNQESSSIIPSLPAVNAQLIIPSIKVEGGIVEGLDEETMNRGFWHYFSASPYHNKGNVVIIGHRYLKLPPNKDTFYHLDKVKKGDEIYIKTDDARFKYEVTEIKIINVADTSVVKQTEKAILTLITCHPLWTSKQRLVIIADKVE